MALNDGTIGEGKDLEESNHGLPNILSWHLHGEIEEKSVSIPSILAKDSNQGLPKYKSRALLLYYSFFCVMLTLNYTANI
jgi:hypothetical protein